jgi:Zn-dependent oligopeptidase
MKQAWIRNYLDNLPETPPKREKQRDLPSDFDFKFAEQTIEAYVAIYEETGEFLPQRALEKLTRNIKNLGIGLAMGVLINAALFGPMIMRAL